MTNIIHFFGEKLADKIERAALPCQGLLRLAIQDKQFDPNKLTFENMQHVFNTSLKERLKRFRIQNIDTVVSKMNVELIDNQSIFTIQVN